MEVAGDQDCAAATIGWTRGRASDAVGYAIGAAAITSLGRYPSKRSNVSASPYFALRNSLSKLIKVLASS